MSEKSFYIVPNTKGYYEKVSVEEASESPKETALTKFAEMMDTDVTAYFDAVEEEPVSYPYGYKYPEGRFELALAIIMANMAKDKSSVYYIEDALNGLNLENMDVVGSLQRAYEELKKADKCAARKSRKYFYKVLRDITGFEFDKEEFNPDEKTRIKPKKKLKRAVKVLDKKGISYDMDSGDRILVATNDLNRVDKAFAKADIDYDII